LIRRFDLFQIWAAYLAGWKALIGERTVWGRMVTDPMPAECAGKSCQFKSHRLKRRRIDRLLLSVSSVALVQAMLLSPSMAQTANWTGGGDGTTWSDGANWSTGAKPTKPWPHSYERDRNPQYRRSYCWRVSFGE
jgi:hypothetical protein